MPVEFQPQFDPAGFDTELRLVLEDVRAGRWKSMQELLTRTGSEWALRTSRSQVLAAAAAQGDALEAWMLEEPRNHDAVMMWARVSTQRALNAHRAGQRPGRRGELGRLEDRARAVCDAAAECWPADPVPWVTRLSLAQFDAADPQQRRAEHRMEPWESLLPHGPWGLLVEVWVRDGYNREAWHRMLEALRAYQQSSFDFTRWVASWAPEGSPLAVLPLYGYVEDYRHRGGRSGGASIFYWATERVSYYTGLSLDRWFEHSPPGMRSPLDLNHLAHALYAGGLDGGAPVFKAIGPYVTPAPWKYDAHDPSRWQEDFLRARRHFLRDPVARPQRTVPRQ